jgi:V8-like Glu-specific endopeptidase
VAASGACPPPRGARPVRSGVDDPLAAHPLAGLFAWVDDAVPTPPGPPGSVRAGTGDLVPPPRAVNASDIRRFASSGLALIGAARAGTFVPDLRPPLNLTGLLAPLAGGEEQPQQQPGGGNAAAPAGPPASPSSPALVGARDVIFTVDTRLLYASRDEVPVPVAPRAAAAAPAGAGGRAGVAAHPDGAVSTDSTPGYPGDDPPPAEGGAGSDPDGGGGAPQAKGWIVLNQWNVLSSRQAYPTRAATWLTSSASGCSGAFIGQYVLASAAHCVYDRSSRRFMPRYDARPAAYLSGGSAGSVVAPYGATSARYYAVMAGWQTATSDAAADPYDIAAITLADPKGQSVGFLGLAVDVANGVAGDALRTAGYPQSAPTKSGTFVTWKQPCYPANSQNGGDAKIVTYSPAGGGSCPAAEPGQSGSGLWDQDNKLRAVLSRGAAQLNIWCELNQANYDFLQRYKNASPTSQPDAPPPPGK